MPFKISLLVIVYLLTAPIDALIRCPLEWVDHSATDLEFPADIVPTVSWGQRNFIARVWQHSESKYYGGRMLDSVAYYNNGSIGLTSGNYQLLSNPNSCKLNWTSTMPDEQFLVPTDSGFIGRAIVEHAYISGVLKNGVFTVVLNENTTLQALRYDYCFFTMNTLNLGFILNPHSNRYEILQSYSPGLKLEVKEFVLQNDNTPARKDIFGKEEVYNGGDVEIRQWVSFTKRITEYVKIDSMRSWGKIWVGRIGLDISMNVADLSVPIGMASFTFGVEDGEFKNSSVTHGSERIIEVVREVTIMLSLNNVILRSLSCNIIYPDVLTMY